MDTSREALFMMKFGQREHMHALLKHGAIHMKPVSYFRGIEDDGVRGDADECLTTLLQLSKVQVIVDGNRLEALMRSVKVRGQHPGGITHIFSASAIFEGDPVRKDAKVFDENVQRFGDSAVAVGGLGKFMSRLVDCLDKKMAEGAIRSYRTDRVEYVSEDKHNGPMGAFRKLDIYSWQKEWRLGVSATAGVDAPFHLSIGSIEDIARFIDVSHFPNRVEEDGSRIHIHL